MAPRVSLPLFLPDRADGAGLPGRPACQETAVQTLLAGSAKPGVNEMCALELALVESARQASCCVLAVLRGPASALFRRR